VKKEKLGCTLCQNVGTLGVEKKMGMKISKSWGNYKISAYSELQKQHYAFMEEII
jgi:hypothetical protein